MQLGHDTLGGATFQTFDSSTSVGVGNSTHGESGRVGSQRLGTDRHGDYEEYTQSSYFPESLIDEIAPNGPETPRERIDAHMKPPFDAEPGSDTTWDRLLTTISNEFDDFTEARDETIVSRYVETATGRQLDKLGSFVFCERHDGETDDHYRARLKLQLAKYVGSGTRPAVVRRTAFVLGTDTERVDIEEPFEIEPARFDMTVRRTDLVSAHISAEDLRDLVLDIKPVGVRALLTTYGGFTHRSERAYLRGQNDPDLAYTELGSDGEPKEDLGGAYATLLFETGDPETGLL